MNSSHSIGISSMGLSSMSLGMDSLEHFTTASQSSELIPLWITGWYYILSRSFYFKLIFFFYFRYKVKENMVYTISLCELIVYGPLCLYTARLYLNSRGIRRDLLSFISSFIQLLGTVYFFFDEYLNGFVNVCPEGR